MIEPLPRPALHRRQILPVNRTGVLLCLRIAVACQCAGLAGRLLFSGGESESDVYGLLYFDWDWPEETALAIDDGGTWACLVAGVLVLAGALRSAAGETRRRAWNVAASLVEGVALLTVGGWFLVLALAQTVRGEPYAEWTPLEQAVRYTVPFALLPLLGSPGAWRSAVANGLLRLAVAATFVAHGYKAIEHYPHFVDLLLLTDARWFGLGLSQGTAEALLTWIGWIDLAVAAGVLLAPQRGPAAYASVWGAITATSRITALGLANWPETLVRAANSGAALALVLYPRRARSFESPAPAPTERVRSSV